MDATGRTSRTGSDEFRILRQSSSDPFFTIRVLIGRTDLEVRRTVVTLVVGGAMATLLFGSTAKGLGDRYAGVWNDHGFIESEFEERVFGDSGFDESESDESGFDEADDFDVMTDAEIGALIREGMAEFDTDVGFEFDDDAGYWQVLYDTTGHSGQIGWTLQTSGIAAVILGFALLLPRRMDRLLCPLAALGSMSLTAYLIHIALITDVWRPRVEEAGWSIGVMEVALVGLMTTMTVICVVFHRWLGVGPFEKLLKYFVLRPGDRLSTPKN